MVLNERVAWPEFMDMARGALFQQVRICSTDTRRGRGLPSKQEAFDFGLEGRELRDW